MNQFNGPPALLFFFSYISCFIFKLRSPNTRDSFFSFFICSTSLTSPNVTAHFLLLLFLLLYMYQVDNYCIIAQTSLIARQTMNFAKRAHKFPFKLFRVAVTGKYSFQYLFKKKIALAADAPLISNITMEYSFRTFISSWPPLQRCKYIHSYSRCCC